VLPVDLWHNTFNQLDSIALGTLLALGATAGSESAALARLEALRTRARGRLLGGALAVLFLAQLIHAPVDAAWSNLVFFPLVSFCCALILFSVIGVRIDPSSPVTRVLLYLGKISFGMYVVHTFSFYLVNKAYKALPFKPSFVVGFGLRGAAALSLTIVLATVSYYWLEKPFLRFKNRFETATPTRESPASASSLEPSVTARGSRLAESGRSGHEAIPRTPAVS
jgi:peptidoglycan/LPS O-acetylase OafA/YrhL